MAGGLHQMSGTGGTYHQLPVQTGAMQPLHQPIIAEAAMGQNVTAVMSCLLQDACQSLCKQPHNGWDSPTLCPRRCKLACVFCRSSTSSRVSAHTSSALELLGHLCVSMYCFTTRHTAAQLTSLLPDHVADRKFCCPGVSQWGPGLGQPQRACPVQAPGLCGPAQQLGGGPAVQAGQAGHAQPVALRCPDPAVQVQLGKPLLRLGQRHPAGFGIELDDTHGASGIVW